MKLSVQGIGVLGPGLRDWSQARAIFRGEQAWVDGPVTVPAPTRLPAAERRRVGASVKLALSVADQVVPQGDWDPVTMPTVFASSGGDAENCHILCESLAAESPQLSPTRFTNSVHNAPAGYWSIAMQSTAASSSLCAFDASFTVGLFEAAILASADQSSVLLVAYDVPYPEPMAERRRIDAVFGAALLLAPGHLPGSQAWLTIGRHRPGSPDRALTPELETLRRAAPAARCLPLLWAMADPQARELALESIESQVLALTVLPCG